MATPQEQLRFKNTFNKFLTDANVLDDEKHQDILRMLNEAQTNGLATPDMLGKYTAYRVNRLKSLRNEKLVDTDKNPLMKTDVFGNRVQATGRDLFIGNQYRPDLGVQGVAQAKVQQKQQMGQQVASDLQRLEGARQILADTSIGGTGRLLGAGLQGIGTGIMTGLRATTGIGAPSAQELSDTLLRTNISDLSAENVLADAAKPAVTGGFRFAQGLGGTMGGVIGSEAGGALLGATTLGATKLAPWLIPLVAAGSSFLGGAVANKISEGAMRNAYGDQYDDVLRVLQQADEESGGAALAGELGNVLLQGSPVLSSGIGGRQVLGTIGKGVFGGKSVRLMGSAEQLGIGSASTALNDMSTLPQMAANPNKFDTLISNFLTKYGATATSAAEKQAAYKIFEPLQPRALPGTTPLQQFGERVSTFGKRIGQFSEFARDTPGVSEWMADAIGEQAVNFGQAAADYKRAYDEAQVTGGKPPSAMEALVNLGFGALFIGNNKFTDVVGGGSRALGSGALDLASRVPGAEGVVEGLRARQRENNFGVLKAFTDSGNRRVVEGGRRSDTEIESGTRVRVGAPRTASAGLARLAPDEIAHSLGDGNVLIYNKSAGTTRTVPHAEVYGGIDDTATVEAGTAMANALSGLPTTKAQTGLKGLLNKEADVVQQVGENKQQIVGVTDSGHVVVRETPPLGSERGIEPAYSIMRVEDLEEGNQEAAAKMLGDSGIDMSSEPTTTIGDDGVPVQRDLFTIKAEQMFLTGDLATYDPKTAQAIKKEFPTVVQFDNGLQLNGRVLGMEANGDLKFQPMGLGMTMIRVPGVNVVSGPKGKSTITAALQPVAVADLVDEVGMSAAMRPKQTAKFNVFVEDADGNSERGLHTINTDGERHAVMLTQDQLDRIPALRQQIKEAVDNVRLTTTSPQAISQARDRAMKDARNALFGEDGLVSATQDFTIGSLINVNTPTGEQRGIVLDNTAYGPSVILDEGDGKPVLIQESQVVSGESTPRPEPEATPTGTPVTGRDFEDTEGSVFDIAMTYRNKQVRMNYLRDKLGDMADATGSELASELFGMDMDAGRVVGTRAEVTDRYKRLAKPFEEAGTASSNPIVKQEMQDIVDTLHDMAAKVRELTFITRRDLSAEKDAARRAEREAERAAGRTEAITAPIITGPVDSVFEGMSNRPDGKSRAEYVVDEVLAYADDADGPTIAREIFGFTTSEKDGTTRILGSDTKLKQRWSSMVNLVKNIANLATSTPEFKAKATDALAKLSGMITTARTDATFITQSALDAEVEAASATPAPERAGRALPPVPTTITKTLIKDLAKIRTTKRKVTFISNIVNASEDMSAEDIASKIFGAEVKEGNILGTASDIDEPFVSLATILDTAIDARSTTEAEKVALEDVRAKLMALAEKAKTLPFKDVAESGRESRARGRERVIAEGQATAIRNSEQNRNERRVTVQQAQAIQGVIRTIPGPDGRPITIIKQTRNADGSLNSRNLAQSIIRKVVTGTGQLTAEEKRVREALQMPEDTDTEWWRNAFQGVSYINDRRGVLRSAVASLVDVAVQIRRNSPDRALTLDDIPAGTLDDNQIQALRQSGFLLDDKTIDTSGIVIHGATERGVRFGVLNQASSSEMDLMPPSVEPTVMDLATQAVSTMSWGDDTTVSFRTEKPKNRAEFEQIVKRLISKSKDKTNSAEKAKAIAELFDTLSHAAVKRRVQLMMEAAEKGYFTTRSADTERTLSPTRGQRLEQIKFDSYLEGELRPLYDQLRQELGLGQNVDVSRWLKTPAEGRSQQVASAIVKIVDNQLEKFYEERFPAFANFDAIPDIANVNGMFVQIYDPDQQVAANVVMAFKSADVSTMVHEIAHAFFEALPMDMQADLSSALGHTLRVPTLTHPSILTYEAQEKFAYGLEMTLANFNLPTDWAGSNVNRGASESLTKVLNGVAEAVRSSYDILTSQAILKVQDGKYTGKEWQIPYTSRPSDGNVSDPNGRVYLWKGAPIILHDGTYAKVNQNFGTTRNGNREVKVIIDGVEQKIKNGEIKAIGGPAEGLTATSMSVLSNWIGQRKSQEGKYRLGLEDSTPAQRAKMIQRDPATGRIFVSRRDIGQATGDITGEDIQLLLNAVGLPRVKANQLETIRQRIGSEELKRLVTNLRNVAREFERNRPGILDSEDNTLRALTRDYAAAVLYGKLQEVERSGSAVQQQQARVGIKGYERPRDYARRELYNNAEREVMRVISANRQSMEKASNVIRAIADGRENANWRIKEVNGKPQYNPRTGELVIEQLRGTTGRKTIKGEYIINLQSGVVQRPAGDSPFTMTDQRWIENDPQFPMVLKGGTIASINSEVKDALSKIGITGIESVRAVSPEFFIARALVEKNRDMFLGNVPAVPQSVLTQVNDVTTFAQQEPSGVQNQQLADDATSPARNLYTAKAGTTVGTSPTITEKPITQMTPDEYNDAVFSMETKSYPKRLVNVPARFIRFGMPDKDANGNFVPSTNWLKTDSKGKYAKEKGISVYRAWLDPITGKYVLESPKGPNLGTQGELVGRFADGDVKAYEFTGETKGNVGSDLEHVIFPKSAKLLGEISGDDIVTEYDPHWTLSGKSLTEDEVPNWDRAKSLPSQSVAVYAAQRAGEPVNKKALDYHKFGIPWSIMEADGDRAYIDYTRATDQDLYVLEGRIRAFSRLDEDGRRYAQGMTYSLQKPFVSTTNPDAVFTVDVTDPINLGNTNLGVTMAFTSASELFKNGDSKEYVARLRQIDNVTKNVTDDTFNDVDATGGFDVKASIAAGDEKPYYTGSVTVAKDSFRGALARAAYMARKMAQPNIHVTSDGGTLEYGVSADGANVVPSVSFKIPDDVSDSITLRAFAESMPSVLSGAIYNADNGTLTLYPVPEKYMTRADAREWTKNAKEAAKEFFFTTDVSSVKEPTYKEGRLKLWNLGSTEFGGQGQFIPYDTVLDIVSTVSPYDSVLDQAVKVSDATQKRLRGDVQDALSFAFGKDVVIPKDARFKREFIPAPVQRTMANHYDMMPADGYKSDPNVIKAYKALQSELDRQFKALGLRIEFMPEGFNERMEPDGYVDRYGGSTTKAASDIAQNKHLFIYPTTPETYNNDKGILDSHPLNEASSYKDVNGRTLKWNDVLRAVHDAISHGVYAVNLSASGSDMAYVTHAMITQDPMAIWALANETRMQNMWKTTNSTVYDEAGQPYLGTDVPPATLQYKFALPVYESVYTGVGSVDAKLRAFGTQLGEYAGTVGLIAGKPQTQLTEDGKTKEVKVQTFYGVGNTRSAFADGEAVVIPTKGLNGKAIFDLKNGTVQTDEDLPRYRVDDSTPMASTAPTTPPAPTPTPESATESVAETVAGTPATPAPPAVVVSARPTKTEPGALRFLYMVNQLLKLGASGDASPVLMQNFPLANILENPDMFIRQLGLQAQVLFNPNTGFHLKDGTIINAQGMRGRKLFHDTLTKEVRNRNTYQMAKNAGLSLAAIDADKLLEEARAKDPAATWDNVDDLGYNTDISVDGEFMKHLPGQGQSERFYALSKDVVKMRQWDDTVHHLIALGYNPTPWTDDEGNFIKSPFNQALKDLAHLLNVMAGDVKVHDVDETDEAVMRFGKFLLYSPRWLTSRLLLDDFGRFMFRGVSKAFGTKGEAYADKVLALNGMTAERLKHRDSRIGAMHARLLNKSWLLWLGLIGLIYGVRATNPRTMEVTVDKLGARMKIGDYSFRAPGAIMTHIELSTTIGEAILEWQAQKGTPNDKPLASMIGDKVNKVLLSRASPVVGLAANIVTGRDTQGAPAFVTDEAVSVFWKDAIGPELERMGIKGLSNMSINKAISERMLWWWVRDSMEMYADQRKFGVKSSEALLKAAGMGALSAQGGRGMYVPKELDFERKAQERMQSPITTTKELFTGVEATPINTDYYDPNIGVNYTDDVAQPFFGATGTDYEDIGGLERDMNL
jgi:hypothetical protein